MSEFKKKPASEPKSKKKGEGSSTKGSTKQTQTKKKKGTTAKPREKRENLSDLPPGEARRKLQEIREEREDLQRRLSEGDLSVTPDQLQEARAVEDWLGSALPGLEKKWWAERKRDIFARAEEILNSTPARMVDYVETVRKVWPQLVADFERQIREAAEQLRTRLAEETDGFDPRQVAGPALAQLRDLRKEFEQDFPLEVFPPTNDHPKGGRHPARTPDWPLPLNPRGYDEYGHADGVVTDEGARIDGDTRIPCPPTVPVLVDLAVREGFERATTEDRDSLDEPSTPPDWPWRAPVANDQTTEDDNS